MLQIAKMIIPPYIKSLTLEDLASLCDEPRRNKPGSNEVRAILAFDKERGFFLYAQDEDVIYVIQDDKGKPVLFRTIEQAIDELKEIPYLSPDVCLEISLSKHS